MPFNFYDPQSAVRGLFAPPQPPISPPVPPPPTAAPSPQWWQQPRTEAEIARQDLLEHGNQPLGVGRLEPSDAEADPLMNRLRPATEQRTGDTFMTVNPEEGEMQGDPSLRENIQFLQPGNIDLNKRPMIPNQGGYSTVLSMSFNEDGREIVIPRTAADGSRILSEDEAIAQYHQTGQHLGMFGTVKEAEDYARQLHEDQAKQYDPQAGSQDQPSDYLSRLWQGMSSQP